jgi:hypothetical protein
MLGFTGGHAAIALDAALGVTDKFHLSHDVFCPFLP